MKKKSDIEKATEAIDAMAKLIKAAKCYHCIHRFELKSKKKEFAKGGIVGRGSGEVILSKDELNKLSSKLKNVGA